MNDIQKELEQLKVDREVDEHNESHEFRLGYVKAMCHAINLVKNLDIPRVSQQSELLKEIFDLTAGAWDDPVISEDLYNRIEAAISFNCG